MKKLVLAGLLASALVSVVVGLTTTADAREVKVELLTKFGDVRNVYGPELVRLEVGDSINFVPTGRGHNVVSIKGMLPEGAEKIKVGFNKQARVTFDKPGIYGIKCTPHVGVGMVGLIVVGEPPSQAFEKVVSKLPPKARAKMSNLLEELTGS